VQVGYLGYPGTSGAPHIDYILGDEFRHSRHRPPAYQEQVVYLPECFQANEERRIAGPGDRDTAGGGLPDAALVLCSFNNQLQKQTRAHRTTSTLFDTQRFCGHLESAYVRMWQRSERGEAPESFAVPPL